MDRIRGAVRYVVEYCLKPVLKVFTSVFRLLGVDSTLAIGIAFYVYLSVYALARTAILVLSLARPRAILSFPSQAPFVGFADGRLGHPHPPHIAVTIFYNLCFAYTMYTVSVISTLFSI